MKRRKAFTSEEEMEARQLSLTPELALDKQRLRASAIPLKPMIKALRMLGHIDDDGEPTEIGKRLAFRDVDPMTGEMHQTDLVLTTHIDDHGSFTVSLAVESPLDNPKVRDPSEPYGDSHKQIGFFFEFGDQSTISPLTRTTDPFKPTLALHRAQRLDNDYVDECAEILDQLTDSEPQPREFPANFDYSSPWTESEVASLHEALLESSMRQLMEPRTSPLDRMDVLVWMQADEETPFSFNACCRLHGSEPSEFRALILNRFIPAYEDVRIPHAIEVRQWMRAIRMGQADSLKFTRRLTSAPRAAPTPTMRSPRFAGLPTLSFDEVFT